MSAKVTWLLPVRNGMPFLTETLQSIEKQSFRDWEVLAWDNGSDDGTLEVLQDWIPRRLPGLVVSGQPLTLGGSLAAMIEVADSELCARIDADDVNLEERLQLQVDFLQRNPAVSVVGSQILLVDERGFSLNQPHSVPLSHADIVCSILSRTPMAHPTVLFRRASILKVGNYRDLEEWGGANIEDYDLWMRTASGGETLANLPEVLLRYRVHQNSSTEVSIRMNRLSRAGNLCFQRNSPALFGCTEREAEQLRARSHRLALPVLLRIARHLRLTQRFEPFRSPAFSESVARLLASRDVLTRLYVAGRAPQRYSLLREMWSIVFDVVEKFRNFGVDAPPVS
ncbi:glycosyltransferase [bacterium]|nr:glycosyltransferase [bacterium]